MIPPRIIGGAVAVAATAVLAAPVGATAAKKPAAPGKKAATQYLVSLGDSYATGYQPNPDGSPGRGTRDGFVYQVPALAAKKGWRLRVVQFACGGSTTSMLLRQKGCDRAALGPGGKPYPGRTQLQAAEAFIRRNRRRVGLVTVSIGGNDVTPCAQDPNPTSCTANATGPMQANLVRIVRRLRKAAGPKVRIVGTTYPNVILGGWLAGPDGQRLATLSQVAFEHVINPALKAQYDTVRARFVNVTKATGGYGSLEQTTTVEGLGTVPVPVARICELTWFCALQDIHARRSAHAIIARLVTGTLPKQTSKPAKKPKQKRKGKARR